MVINCFEGLAVAWYSSWHCVSESTLIAWRWIYSNILCPPCICSDRSAYNRVRSASPKPRIRSNESSPLCSPPNKVFKAHQSPDQMSKEAKEPFPPPQPPLRTAMKSTQQAAKESVQQTQQPDATKPSEAQPAGPDIATSVKAAAEKHTETVITTQKPTEDQTITRTVKQRTQAASQETFSHSGSKDLSYEPQVSESPRPRSSPPKIDFVETGSIFGDRKRHSHHTNLLLMDNGRFKSPGRPNVLPGPGGRTIRISFQTGFPSIKSIESRAPPVSVRSKMSNRSDDSTAHEVKETTSPAEINPEVPKKAFAKKKKKKRKSTISRKSMKSVISKGPIIEIDPEKDDIRETPPDENFEEPVVKSVESQGNSPK